ncbi:MAG: DHH family phosphoesterase [Phycisphaerae bacterium]
MSKESSPTPVPADLLAAIRSASRIALAGHVTPDADCFGSVGSLAIALQELGKQTYIAMPEGSVSRKLEFLFQYGAMRAASPSELAACDLALVLDTAKDRRVNIDGKLEALPNTKVANVDHHASNTQFGTWNWVDAGRSSASEMAYELIRALGCQVTPTVATLLYGGIHSDTQGFSLSNTTARSLGVAHELALAGAQIPWLCEKLHRSHSRGEFELRQIVYRNTRVSDDGRLAWSTVSNPEFAHTGCVATDIDDQVEIPRTVEGIAVVILFSEGNAGKIRMNFRGERGISVLELAQKFGGGGHRSAAGAILDGTISEVAERVLPEALRFVAALPH